jgi:hypothetical protein
MMTKRAKPARHAPHAGKERAKEEASDIKYFAPEPIEKEKVDKEVTQFLLEEAPDTGRPGKASREELLEEPERPSRDMTNWYVLATVVVLLIVVIMYYVNIKTAEQEPSAMPAAPVEIPLEEPAAVNQTPVTIQPQEAATNLTGLRDLVLNTTGMKPVKDFEELSDNAADIINDCNQSPRCKAALKGYQKIGLRTESTSYTIRIDKDGRIVDLRETLEAETNFVIDASEEDLVGLYNGLATNDEDIVLLKLQKILPSQVLIGVMQGMMAG